MEQILLGMVGMALMLAAFAAGVRMAKSLAFPSGALSASGARPAPTEASRDGGPKGRKRSDGNAGQPLPPPDGGTLPKGEGFNGARQATDAEAVQAAFEDLLAYSAETAYGMNRGVRDNG